MSQESGKNNLSSIIRKTVLTVVPAFFVILSLLLSKANPTGPNINPVLPQPIPTPGLSLTNFSETNTVARPNVVPIRAPIAPTP